MTFTSELFLPLLVAFLTIYYLIKQNTLKWVFLLLGSMAFYLNIHVGFSLILLLVSVITYFTAKAIQFAKNEKSRVLSFRLGIVFMLLPLLLSKYLLAIVAFLGENIEIFKEVSNSLHWIVLPVGISFYTFMALGYIIDVYNEEIDSEPNYFKLLLFLSFFPLVLSGPIERGKNLLKQFNSLPEFDVTFINQGIKLMIWGYFMKLVVADRLGLYIDLIYGSPQNFTGTSIMLASILYPFQVYTDLGGYSLITIGIGQLLGVKIIPNFNRPFFASSMAEFWRRWHMSLINWFNKYLYSPLSYTFRKSGINGILISLLITFIVSGIWHGANFTFIVWGILQGIFLGVEALLLYKKQGKISNNGESKSSLKLMLGIGLTFVLFAISQVYARATSVAEANHFFHKMIFNAGTPYVGSIALVIGLLALSMVLYYDYMIEYNKVGVMKFLNRYKSIKYFIISLIIYSIITIGNTGSEGKFIYFNF